MTRPDGLTLSLAEAADALGVGRELFRRLLADGQIATVVVGGRRLVPRYELEDFLRRSASTEAKTSRGGKRTTSP